MKLQDQVCTEQQADLLKELGIDQESLFYHTHSDWGVMPKESIDFSGEPSSAFTVSELGAMLPTRVMNGDDDYFPQIHKGRRGWYIQYQTNKKDVTVNVGGEIDRPRGYLFNTYRVEYNMAEAFASYLILLLESNLITPAEGNERLK